MMDHAFDALDGALPDERAGFYGEALALALSPARGPRGQGTYRGPAPQMDSRPLNGRK